MFIKLKLANGDEVTINTNRIESIERADDDPSVFEVHVGTRHYAIDADEHDALLHTLQMSQMSNLSASPLAAAGA